MAAVTDLTLLLLSLLVTGSSSGSAPVVTEHPISTTVARNGPVTLNCAVSGEPEPSVTWYKDGELVRTGAGDHIVLLPGGSLFFLRTVHNKRSSDSGVYRCRATNDHGTVYSSKATLTVTCKYSSISLVGVRRGNYTSRGLRRDVVSRSN